MLTFGQGVVEAPQIERYCKSPTKPAGKLAERTQNDEHHKV